MQSLIELVISLHLDWCVTHAQAGITMACVYAGVSTRGLRHQGLQPYGQQQTLVLSISMWSI